MASDCSIILARFGIRTSVVAALAILASQPGFAESEKNSVSPKILLVQGQSEATAEESGAASGGADRPSASSSERIKKYMGEDEPAAVGPGRAPGAGVGQRGPAGDMNIRRERMRQRLQQMSPEKREQVMQEMKDRRMRKRGLDDGGGMDNRVMGGAEGGPGGEPAPRFAKPRAGGPIKGGKLFGRAPLDLTVLNLTAEQKTKIQSMRTQDGQKSRQLQVELRQRRDKFRDMLFDPAISPDQIINTHREILKLQSQTQDIMVNDFLGIRKLLTKEQMELLPQVRPEDPPRPAARQRRRGAPGGEPEVSGRPRGDG